MELEKVQQHRGILGIHRNAGTFRMPSVRGCHNDARYRNDFGVFQEAFDAIRSYQMVSDLYSIGLIDLKILRAKSSCTSANSVSTR